MIVSKGEAIKGQFAEAGFSTKTEVLHFNFNEDTQCPTSMNEEQSDVCIIGVILAQKYILKKGLELFRAKVDAIVTKELT